MIAQHDAIPNEPGPPLGSGGAMPLLLAADLQDHLMCAGNDLDRLQRLLDDAGQALMVHFYGASARLKKLQAEIDAGTAASAPAEASAVIDKAMEHLAGAIVAMQFQDMSTQLIAHTQRRLRNCTDRIARDSMGDDEDGDALVDDTPLKPNPVTQDEMDAGSIELF